MSDRGAGAVRRWIGVEDAADSPPDSGQAHRAQRGRRVGASTAAALAAQFVALAVSFVAIPLTIGYLGIERYGVLVTLGALTSLFAFADLGLGNGLLNLISDANGRDDREAARTAVSSAAVMLLAVAVAFGLAFAVAYPFVDWPSLLQVRSPLAASEAGPTAAILFAVFLIAIPLGIVERVRLGYQEGFLNSLTGVAGGLIGLLALVVAITFKAGLPVLVLATSAPTLIALLINGGDLFRNRRPWLRPQLRLADRRVGIQLARVGSLFLVLQLAVAVAYQSDVVVAAAVLGPEAAATYSVTLKFFMVAPALVALFLTTLWPAYAEAKARNDGAWVVRTFRRSFLVAVLLTGAAATLLVATGPWLINVWTRGVVEPPLGLLLGAAIWSVVYAAFNTIAILFNAMSVIAFQVGIAIVMAATSIVLSIVFAKEFGVSGIVWGTLIAYVVCSAVPAGLYLPRVLKRIRMLDLNTGAAADA